MSDDRPVRIDDPFRDAAVERALQRYIGAIPEEAVEEMRRFLTEALATHPVAMTLMDRARPREVPDMSDLDGKDGQPSTQKNKKREGGEG